MDPPANLPQALGWALGVQARYLALVTATIRGMEGFLEEESSEGDWFRGWRWAEIQEH